RRTRARCPRRGQRAGGRRDARRRVVDRADGDGRGDRFRLRGGAWPRRAIRAGRRGCASPHDTGIRGAARAMTPTHATGARPWRAWLGNAAMLLALLAIAFA